MLPVEVICDAKSQLRNLQIYYTLELSSLALRSCSTAKLEQHQISSSSSSKED